MSEVQQDELPGLKPTPASDSHSELRSNRSGNADKLSRFFESVSGSLGFSGLTAQSPAASQGVSGVLVFLLALPVDQERSGLPAVSEARLRVVAFLWKYTH